MITPQWVVEDSFGDLWCEESFSTYIQARAWRNYIKDRLPRDNEELSIRLLNPESLRPIINVSRKSDPLPNSEF